MLGMMSTDPVLLEFRDVGKSFPTQGPDGPVHVLRQVQLKVRSGERLAIVGPSGSGKSTLLNLAGALDRADSGQVLFDGEDLGRLDEAGQVRFRGRAVGFVFQSHHLLPHCSVLENVLIPVLGQQGRVDPSQMDRARSWLDRVGLGHRMDFLPGRLSGGERQRVALVRALILEPRLLLADEPTGSLDRRSAAEVADLLVELNAAQGCTLLLVTHSLELARRMDRVLEMQDGALVPPSAVGSET
jgi:lipoprotein-releasing system ATP-binding protein